MAYEICTDVLVIGGGGAGLKAALAAADAGSEVLLVLKDRVARSGITPTASDGIAAPINDDDTVEAYFDVSYAAGQGLADVDFIEALTGDAKDRLVELESYSAKFKMNEDGSYMHTAKGDFSCHIVGGGHQMSRLLGKQVAAHPKIRLVEDAMILSLIYQDNKVFGAVCFDKHSGNIGAIKAKATILCTGGYEELWKYTDTSTDSTGEGLMLAYHAGAELIDLEMVQFYPTVGLHPLEAYGNFIAYDLFNEGMLNAQALNGNKEPIVEMPCEIKEFLRKSYLEIIEGRGSEHGGYYFVPRPGDQIEEKREKAKKRMADRYTHLDRMGIDIVTDTIELIPAAHYCFGGIRINVDCETSVSGLYAAGECSGNVHGAGRPFSNALAETQVFGNRAGIAAAEYAQKADYGEDKVYEEFLSEQGALADKYAHIDEEHLPLEIRRNIQELLWLNAGPVRNENAMVNCKQALEKEQESADTRINSANRTETTKEFREYFELKAMLELAPLLVKSALARKESRGFHYRSDFPETSKTGEHICIRKQGSENEVFSVPVK